MKRENSPSTQQFKSLDSLREELEFNNQFTIFYKGEYYEIEPPYDDGKFLIYKHNENGEFGGNIENIPSFATYDEMLDNFKAHDGRTMREFILEAYVTDAAVTLGHMPAEKRYQEQQKINPNAKHPYPEAKGQFNLNIGEGNGGLE